MPVAMLQCPQRTLDLVVAIAKLPKDKHPSGIIFEEPLGEYFGEEVAICYRPFARLWTIMIGRANGSAMVAP